MTAYGLSGINVIVIAKIIIYVYEMSHIPYACNIARVISYNAVTMAKTIVEAAIIKSTVSPEMVIMRHPFPAATPNPD